MIKRKEVQDREVASKTVEKGLLIVHTGPGNRRAPDTRLRSAGE
jgi:cob(I)alamin adenosyltransferase